MCLAESLEFKIFGQVVCVLVELVYYAEKVFNFEMAIRVLITKCAFENNIICLASCVM